MKKIVIIIAMALALSNLSALDTGYAIAPVGQKSPSGEVFGAIGISGFINPLGELHAADVEGEILLAMESPAFKGFSIKLSSPLFTTPDHPFGAVFSNTALWAPKLSVGVQYLRGENADLYLGFAPFNFQDTIFVYEFMSPYALYDFESKKWGYGAYIMRFISFF